MERTSVVDNYSVDPSNAVWVESSQRTHLQPKVIVVLEDDPDIMAVIALILSTDGYEVAQCNSVKQFYNVVSQKKPDLFVLDISPPDGNGLEVCKGLKEDSQTAAIPVVLMSAHMHHLVSSGRQDDFITKPFNIMDFRNKIKRFV